MKIAMEKSFSIEDKICNTTGELFGIAYKGMFSIKRASMLDKKNIAVKDAASMSFAGPIAPGTLSDSTAMTNYIFCYVTTVATEKLPEWFNMEKMFEPEDEDAVLAVWSEVCKFIDSFRRENSGGNGKSGSKEPALLVSEKVHTDAE